MPLQETSGTASYDAFGGGVVAEPNYIESCFSTWLYTGNGSTQTITNGIDLAGKGGMVWIKNRSDVKNNILVDTARGANNWIASNLTNAQASDATKVSSFSSTGFTVGSDSTVNLSTQLYTSWTFRKQPKFFDVVTYTGNGVAGRTVAHNLGSVPGCVIVKRTDVAVGWAVYHRGINGGSNPQQYFLQLNSTSTPTISTATWNNTEPTDTEFTVGINSNVNVSGGTYVAYLFAHNAGGFGLTGTDNVISCGSYTGTGSSGNFVSLGYEPQWVLIKNTSQASDWSLYDNMRGVPTGNDDKILYPNLSNAEDTASGVNDIDFNATGFTLQRSTIRTNTSGNTYIYIAIRRGPMKTPTSGTSVFDVQTSSGAAGTQITTAFPIDLVYALVRTAGEHDMLDRLRGISNTSAGSPTLDTTTTDFESSKNVIYNADQNVGFKIGSYFGGISNVFYNFRRAPGFFDEVCYTGTGSATTFNHNLGVAPELMIIKDRTVGEDWTIYSQTLATNQALKFTTAAREQLANYWNTTRPTSSVFSVGDYAGVNSSGDKYVAYLFASCPGVSKVGSYTGNGSTQTINCGFTGGARFVLIKRTDSTGDWYVYDTARGMTTLTDPYLLLNSTAAESATLGSVTSVTGGFALNASILAAINTNAASYTYLAIS